MSEYEMYLARRGSAPPAPPTPAAAPEGSASGAFMTEYEKYLAGRKGGEEASAGLRTEFSQWGSAAEREEAAKRAWLAKR